MGRARHRRRRQIEPTVHHLLFAVFGWMGIGAPRARPGAVAEGEGVHRGGARARRLDRRIIFRHLLPNSIGPIIVALTFTSVVGAILAESTLSFFGFGPQPGPGDVAGATCSAARKGYVGPGNWWLCCVPRRRCSCSSCSRINFIGDGLRDAFDPKQQTAEEYDRGWPTACSAARSDPRGRRSRTTDDGLVQAVRGVDLDVARRRVRRHRGRVAARASR